MYSHRMCHSALVPLVIVIAIAGLTGRALADVQPHGGMLRYPDVSATHIVFSYANDLWVAPRAGGLALPLSSPAGREIMPRFSPDGQTIVFAGNYDGNRDLYTISLTGGAPWRVTHHPASEIPTGWTPDGRLIFQASGMGAFRFLQLFTVDPAGGLPERLPVPYGGNGAISDDGTWLAYTPSVRDSRTWKRYRGGRAADIWLFNLKDHSSKQVTDWEGTDSLPMWHGDLLYYLSDAGPKHRLNIWQCEPDSSSRRQITWFDEFDVKWPSIGPGPDGGGEIVFQNGSDLYLLNLRTEQTGPVEIVIPGDRPTIRPRRVDADKHIQTSDVSSTGKRAVFEARGDIWTVPAEHGVPHNLTRSSGVAERHPAWSPDGRWIAYFSDVAGEYDLYLTQSDGKGETRKLAELGPGFRHMRGWSPDSKYIGFVDKTGAMYLCEAETGRLTLIDVDPTAARPLLNWSHDSRWIVYTRRGENRQPALWLYNVESGEKHQLTSGMFNDFSPTFDRRGDYLFFASCRGFKSPIYEDVGSTFVYASTYVLLAVPLRTEVTHPWAPENDQETWDDADQARGDEEKEEDEDGDEDGDEDEEGKAREVVEIDRDGFEQRAWLLPVKPGNFGNLAVNNKNQLLYVRRALPGVDQPAEIKLLDLEDDKQEEQTVVSGAGSFAITADGKRLLVRAAGDYAIVDAKADQKLDKKIALEGMTAVVDPRAEWRQVFIDAWRIQRDYFYVANMHGVDWPGIREQYAKMLADCISRDDVAFVISEMIAELNIGHAYYMSGPSDVGPSVSVGMLGVDFELHDGAYRLAKIHAGGPWDVDARGPLSQPGVDVKEGNYLLAVNGIPLDIGQDPWAAFQGLANRVATLTVSDKPTIDDEAREIVVKLLGKDDNLRYRSWIDANRRYVDEQTGGRVGYIHVPDTGRNGQNELFRQFYGQRHKDALIIDERWNRGGQIPNRFIELLNRPLLNYWAIRDGRDTRTPYDAHFGPKCMLINGSAGSGGDMFPALFRQNKLGQLIGRRTWGGLVGLSGSPGLIDGTRVTVPTFGYYEIDGTWGVEGHGVDPDIEVIDDPALMVDGGDPQLDAAIEHILAELERNPYVRTERPADPDRSGMGIREEDK